MPELATMAGLAEPQFAVLVDGLAADPNGCEQLTELLREDHPLYDQRGTATTVRMRGWVLLALARIGLSDAALLFVLEELDTGLDAYLVAAAARALRSYPSPNASFAPFVMRAITNIRYHDEPISFEGYGEYARSSTGTTALGELLTTLAWLGPHARSVLTEVESLRSEREISPKLKSDFDRAVKAIRCVDGVDNFKPDSCCKLPSGLAHSLSWLPSSRRDPQSIEKTVFQDQEGTAITFKEFFRGHPSIVFFFYTRCDNPLKCSLTITKLARVQKLLENCGLSNQIQTAAITYDPGFDLPERLRRYGLDRGVRMDAHHRLLRATDGFNEVRRHFELGVNFIESLVNRHRIEVYILDARGRIAASFKRIHWSEQEVVDRATELLKEKADEATPNVSSEPSGHRVPRKATSPIFGTLASLGVAFFPKCPICWSAYMSMFSIAGLQQVPYSPWLQPVLAAVMLINLASVWFRGRSTSRMTGFYLVSAGALAIVVSKMGIGWEGAAVWGVALTLAGSLISSLRGKNDRTLVRS